MRGRKIIQGRIPSLLKDYVGRPSALTECKNLTKTGGARIFLKREDLNHTGAHKINNCIGQALLAKRMGKKKIIAETGAGMHGVASATVAALMGMECDVYMGEVDIQRQAPNVLRMKVLGARVVPVSDGQGLSRRLWMLLLGHSAMTHQSFTFWALLSGRTHIRLWCRIFRK